MLKRSIPISESENEIVPSRSTHRPKSMRKGRDYFSSLLTQRNGSGYKLILALGYMIV